MTETPEEYTGGKLDKNLCQQIAENAYRLPLTVERYLKSGYLSAQLMESSKTIKLYRLQRSADGIGYFVLGIRGTKPGDPIDMKADVLLAMDKLDQSARWRADRNIIRKWKNGKYSAWSYQSYKWIGVGHSLGAAICDEALRENLIDYAVSYNGAVQHKDRQSPKHYKIYSTGDPLYKYGKEIVGQDEPEDLRPPKDHGVVSLLSKLPSYIGTISSAAEAASEHSIKRFRGGSKRIAHTPADLFKKKDEKKKSSDVVWKKESEIKEDEGLKLGKDDKGKGNEKKKKHDPITNLRRELLCR